MRARDKDGGSSAMWKRNRAWIALVAASSRRPFRLRERDAQAGAEGEGTAAESSKPGANPVAASLAPSPPPGRGEEAVLGRVAASGWTAGQASSGRLSQRSPLRQEASRRTRPGAGSAAAAAGRDAAQAPAAAADGIPKVLMATKTRDLPRQGRRRPARRHAARPGRQETAASRPLRPEADDRLLLERRRTVRH